MNKIARKIDKYSFKILIYVFIAAVIFSIIFRAYCHFYYAPEYYGSWKNIFTAPIIDINYIKDFFRSSINIIFLSIIIVSPFLTYGVTAICSKIVENEDAQKLKEELKNHFNKSNKRKKKKKI
ncbi:MAG: hypothetical protein ABIK92_02750 [Pseudomonadota bacterium]